LLKRALVCVPLVYLSACAANSPISAFNCEPEPPPQINVRHIDSEALFQHLHEAPRDNRKRAAELVGRLEAVGCRGDALEVLSQRPARLPNIICELPGSSDSTIVIGAHYDKTPRGRGVVDNWTGAALLPLLYRHLSAEPRQHTFQFIGFAEEERDLVGSKAFVRSLSGTSRERIVAMVNLDTFGLTGVKVDPRSAPHLTCKLFAAAEWRQLPLQVAGMREPISGDWEPFRSKGVPVLNLHSITRRGLQIIHSSRDRLKAVDQGHYYDTYRLIHAYLYWLDATLIGSEDS